VWWNQVVVLVDLLVAFSSSDAREQTISVLHRGYCLVSFATNTIGVAANGTGKHGNCEWIATSGCPMPCQSFSALIMTQCQVWSCWTYPFPCYSVFCCWYITLPCDLDLWLSTFAVYRLWYDETLYQCQTQSSNPRQSYCNSNIWPNDLEHVLRVALGSGIIFSKFDLWQFICAWITAFFMVMCYVILWPWPSSRWPWKFVVHQMSCDESLYKSWVKWSNPRLNYW